MNNQESPHQCYLKGIELYQSGAVTMVDGAWRVNGFVVTGYPPLKCDCRDYENGIRPCVHIYAARAHVKNLGNEKTNAK